MALVGLQRCPLKIGAICPDRRGCRSSTGMPWPSPEEYVEATRLIAPRFTNPHLPFPTRLRPRHDHRSTSPRRTLEFARMSDAWTRSDKRDSRKRDRGCSARPGDSARANRSRILGDRSVRGFPSESFVDVGDSSSPARKIGTVWLDIVDDGSDAQLCRGQLGCSQAEVRWLG